MFNPFVLRPNKKIRVIRITGQTILGKVGAHIFFKIFFLLGKIYICMHFERRFAF